MRLGGAIELALRIIPAADDRQDRAIRRQRDKAACPTWRRAPSCRASSRSPVPPRPGGADRRSCDAEVHRRRADQPLELDLGRIEEIIVPARFRAASPACRVGSRRCGTRLVESPVATMASSTVSMRRRPPRDFGSVRIAWERGPDPPALPPRRHSMSRAFCRSSGGPRHPRHSAGAEIGRIEVTARISFLPSRVRAKPDDTSCTLRRSERSGER